jgi:hypothetical protein
MRLSGTAGEKSNVCRSLYFFGIGIYRVIVNIAQDEALMKTLRLLTSDATTDTALSQKASELFSRWSILFKDEKSMENLSLLNSPSPPQVQPFHPSFTPLLNDEFSETSYAHGNDDIYYFFTENFKKSRLIAFQYFPLVFFESILQISFQTILLPKF